MAPLAPLPPLQMQCPPEDGRVLPRAEWGFTWKWMPWVWVQEVTISPQAHNPSSCPYSQG